MNVKKQLLMMLRNFYSETAVLYCTVLQLILLEIDPHDDGEDDLGQVNEDDDQPFGLSPGYNLRSRHFGFGWDHLRTQPNVIFNRPGVAGAVLQTPLSLIN